MPDNYSMWKRHEAEQEAWLSRLPVCEYCDNPIQDDYYFEIGGGIICQDCLDAFFRKNVEDYI